MKVVRIRENIVVKEALVETFTLASGDKIPAIVVGETGRGRQLGVVPVALKKEKYEEWKEKGQVYVYNISVGSTKTGRPKLIEIEEESDKIVAIFETPIGFRGYNSHKFPDRTEILTEGIIAQGTAGRMGSGNEYVVILPVPSVVKVYIGGRRYGAPSEYVYHFTDKDVFVRTGEEESLIDGNLEEFVID